MRKFGISLSIVFLLLASMFHLSVVAEEEYKQQLPDEGVNFECKYCHKSKLGGEALNPFGEDFKNNNKTYDESLKNLDSDGDSFTNQQEFNAEPITNPGDPDSYPDEPLDMIVVLIIIVVIIALVIGCIFILKD